jgi:hypothetical protein
MISWPGSRGPNDLERTLGLKLGNGGEGRFEESVSGSASDYDPSGRASCSGTGILPVILK